MKKSLLIIDDDEKLRKVLSEDFIDKGYEVITAGSSHDLKTKVFDAAIVDLRLTYESGLQVIAFLKSANPLCRIVVLTGYGSVATAVEAVKLGAYNYLNKPVSSDEIEAALNADVEMKNHSREEPTVKTLDQHEHEYIQYILTKNEGNITKTAQQLGLHRQSLQRKLKKYPNR